MAVFSAVLQIVILLILVMTFIWQLRTRKLDREIIADLLRRIEALEHRNTMQDFVAGKD